MVNGSGEEGCDHGFWRKDDNFSLWVNHTPGDSFDSAFGVRSSFGGTLLEALERGGGGEKALARQGVAGLLNAATSEVSYGLTTGQVIQMVRDTYGSGDFDPASKELEQANKQGCPLK
jgi:hypothetical protein